MLFLYVLLLKLISAMASQHRAVCVSASLPISLRLRLDFLGFHAKLHAQTSTSWTLCAALTETSLIALRLRLDLLGFHRKIMG